MEEKDPFPQSCSTQGIVLCREEQRAQVQTTSVEGPPLPFGRSESWLRSFLSGGVPSSITDSNQVCPAFCPGHHGIAPPAPMGGRGGGTAWDPTWLTASCGGSDVCHI